MSNTFLLPVVSPLGPEIFLAGVACCLIIFDSIFKDQGNVLPIISISGAAVTILMVLSSNGLGFSGMYNVDGFSVFFKIICLLALIFTVLMSHNHLKVLDVKRVGEYYSLMLFSCVGMMVMASALDLIVLYLGLELMALSVYCLVGIQKKDKRASEAAIKYFLLGAFASCLFLFGLSYIYGITGTTSLTGITKFLTGEGIKSNPAFLLGLGLVLIAFSFKVAAAPFHMWTPDAYEGAMTPVTGFMSVAPKAAGFAALSRLLFEAFPALHGNWVIPFEIMIFLTMAIGNITAISQVSIKRMLAYSSIAHAGYALLGLLPGTAQGVSATMNYLFIYLFMNMGAFAVIVLLQQKGLAGERLEDYKGLAKSHPVAAGLMLVFMFSLTGIPPTAGFIGKFNLFVAALNGGYTGMVIWAVIFSAISAYFYLRVVMLMYMHEPQKDVALVHSGTLSAVLAMALAGVLIIGIYPNDLLSLAGIALGR